MVKTQTLGVNKYWHLDGVVQGRGRRVERQVLKGFNPRSFPSSLLRPVHSQHVIREKLPKAQAGRVGLGVRCPPLLDGQICSLRGGNMGRNRERKREQDRETTKDREVGVKADM